MTVSELQIGRRRMRTSSQVDVIDPAIGRPFAAAPEADQEILAEAIDAAAAAAPAWARSETERRRALRGLAAAFRAAKRALGEIITREQGKPLGAAEKEVVDAARWLETFASFEIPVDTVDVKVAELVVYNRPFGLVAAITPSNFPVLIPVFTLAPALLVGNAVIWKPSPDTPLSALMVMQLAAEVLPPGALTVLPGGAALGELLCTHPAISKISGTGSTETGRAILSASARGIKPVTLELGGNDAAIVLPDVDVEVTARRVFHCAFYNLGQACTAIKRLFVHRTIIEPFIQHLVRYACEAKLGPGLAPQTEYGPLTTDAQRNTVDSLVRASLGEVKSGGRRLDGPGFFYPLTIVRTESARDPLVEAEQFGPALPVVPFGDIEEGLHLANSSRFALGGSIWSSDTRRAVELAEAMECGTVWINLHGPASPYAPMSGWKASGIGHQNGRSSIFEYTRKQVIALPTVHGSSPQ